MAASKRKCKHCSEYSEAIAGVKTPAGFFCSHAHAVAFAIAKTEKARERQLAKSRRQRDADTKEVLPVAQFKVSGKVMVDDKTGAAIIWPASKHFRYIIYGYGFGRNLLLDTDDAGSINHFFGFSDRRKTTFFSWESGDKKRSPLTNARRSGLDVRSTTRCQPLPDRFERRKGGV